MSRIEVGGLESEIKRLDDKIGFALPHALVEVQDRTGTFQEMRISWENPGLMIPRSQRVLIQDTPDRALGHLHV